MPHTRLPGAFRTVFVLCWGLATVSGADDPSLRAAWPVKAAHLFQGSLRDDIGFSFTWQGKKVGPALPEGWTVSTRPIAGGTLTEFRHPSGLVVIREAHPYPEAEAIEYTVQVPQRGAIRAAAGRSGERDGP